ncbi:NAD-dependent epimerase/dehydratase family protein [Leptospira bandrabouensis]|uniref:NAD-dependent epimerase/dehydratase family protein n=1 Tax=Leptospira bandrabouensis TaxID=2484903 RepID=UPI001EE90C51|nr:NAD(P)-dependent oxidoreductase [Leptospira bandrabouensis]MCG6144944.1 NAD(P)-dependent oxidoreductase [Leptospira bandrabouensis]MCG6160419.1 NAD(P)-dependent oxidoreductase [Leptospira bandrabouensis]MCG6164351.1 NAD(P)-dependent oxidoreductase [Leptospira bandrabouensis]
MKVLVFGGSGFLGSHVADALSDAGHEVTIFDLVKSPWLRSDQKFVSGDLLDEKIVSEIVSGFDVVYNFAALADLNQALDKPVDTIRINVLGNTYILEACRKHKVKRFIYASTVYVYSREGGFYRCSKQASESYIEEYQKCFGLDFTILRYGSLYGPRSDESNGLYRIVKSALETGRITYEGSADSLREYIHVEDAARASVVAMGEEFKNQSVVLTGQEPMRVIELLKMLAEILGRPDSVEFLEGDQVGHYVRTPYAYQPKLGRKYIPPMHVDLGQGLLQLIDEVKFITNR